jgi:hypothetical protein
VRVSEATPASTPTIASGAPDSTVQAPQTAEQKFKAKVNGKETEVPVSKLIERWQKEESADQKFQKASQIQKAQEEFFEKMRTGKGREDLVKLLGKDVAKKYAEELLLEEIEWMELPESERRAREFEKKAKTLEEQLSEKEKAAQEQERNSMREKAVQEIDSEVADVLKSLKVKPSLPILYRIVEQMIVAQKSKGAVLPAKEAFNRTMTSIGGELPVVYEALGFEKFLEVLPKKFLDELRNKDRELVSSQFPTTVRRKPEQSSDAPAPQKKKRGSSDDWFHERAKFFGLK